MIDRTETSRALAKVIAYKNLGNEEKAEEWFRQLAWLLDYEGLVN